MDETAIMALIAEGETTSKVDYKRELHLDRAEDKAEFIKDIISLANSAPNCEGYLLVGVDDTKYIVGTSGLEEERIQQLVHSHIRPPVTLRCIMIPTSAPGLPSIGAIEIEGTERPYRVTIPIDKLKQDDVFIRHGSVVDKATPEEICNMEEESRGFKEAGRMLRAAEKLLGLGKLQEAIDVYTRAIMLMPSAEGFLGRGKAYRYRLEQPELSWDAERELANNALADLSTVIRLPNLIEIEKEARLERLKVKAHVDYEGWNDDLDWLKSRVEGPEYGEVLYLEYRIYESFGPFARENPSEMLTAMDKAIQLGYKEPGVYELHAIANYHLCNYGLALQDINAALANTNRLDERVDRLSFRAQVQVKMGQFAEVYSSLEEARRLHSQVSSREFISGEFEVDEDEILWRYSLESEFGEESQVAKDIVQVLIGHIAAQRVAIPGKCQNGEFVEPSRLVTSKAWIKMKFGPIVSIIRRIVGEDFWRSC